MKTIAKISLLIAAIALVSVTAFAQVAGKHFGPVTGGADRVLASSTNVIAHGINSTNTYGLPGTSSNFVFAVTEFDKVGFTWSYGNGSNATVLLYKSYDGGTTFESVPSYTYAGPAATASAYSTNALLDCTGATHIALVMRNASTIDQTNAYVCIYLKSPKYGAKVATQ